ncbi:MAG: type I-E CRISPR-associated protein Cas7/Cse4/CasC [Caldilineaceae bacterium]
MLVQFHILQNYAPSNLNRDDSGAPKDAIFGGAKRGRISSQCIKRSMRHSLPFQEKFENGQLLAMRTKRLPGLIDTALQELNCDDAARQAIVERIPEIGKKGSEGESNAKENKSNDIPETRQLIFMSPYEIPVLAEKLQTLYQDLGADAFKKLPIDKLEDALKHDMPRSVDVAMFGRMTTSTAFENVQASVQVAHSLTTSAIETEFDYFTAVDDISGETGAGMIGDVEFNSATHYKYLNVHWEQLLENLGGDVTVATQAIGALLDAFAVAQPTGKQNSFAAHNLPDIILVEVSVKNLPISYANAFLRPVRPTFQQSLMDASVEHLDDYMQRLRKAYALKSNRAYLAVFDHAITDAEAQESLPAMQEWLSAQFAAQGV